MKDQITFEQYLEGKRISPQKFKTAEPDKYRELARDFEQMHPGSFTAQYLFLINPIRRKYTAEEKKAAAEAARPKAAMRPKINR